MERLIAILRRCNRRDAAAVLLGAVAVLAAPQVRAADEGLLGALWHGQAHFEQIGNLSWLRGPDNPTKYPANNPIPSSGPWLATLDGKWYLFSRDKPSDQRPSYCPNSYYEVSVRESTDQGRHWSAPQVAAAHSSESADACTIVDGMSFYDAETDTWHILAQCLAAHNAGGWSMCHYTRAGRSPMGQFTPDPANPVIRNGQLWSEICSGPGKGCRPGATGDEGTPAYLGKAGGYYYFTFHGWDPQDVRSYRGEAKTRDFRTFITAGPDLPSDALFGPVNCRAWAPQCVGAGAASHVITGDYQYMLLETPSDTLSCTHPTNWEFALVRAPLNTRPTWRGGWEAYPRNPLIVPSWDRLDLTYCALQYARMFVDRGQVFLLYEDFGPDRTFVERRLMTLVSGPGPGLVLQPHEGETPFTRTQH
jgi:hypothetical protein